MSAHQLKARHLLYLNSSGCSDVLPETIRCQGWEVQVASHSGQAHDLIAKRNYMVGLVHVDGSNLQQLARDLQHLKETNNAIHWVALLSDRELLLQPSSGILANYFYDYHTLPMDTKRLEFTLGHAYGMAEIANQAALARNESRFVQHRMIGKSACMQALFRKIHRVANLDLNVLIRGESGTGKELTAEAIHRTSSRAAGPFVAVNCGALPKDLIQTELFGHERGAFTGAQRRHIGRIEAASGGTLFLDEIGDLSLELQVNLLRFLQEKVIDRIGGSASLPVDVRIIAATNVDLEKAVEKGLFREDLYYRLNVLQLQIPPLRERPEDIPVLAEFFFNELSKRLPDGPKGFSQSSIDIMNSYSWPGNVRELINRVQRAVAMCEERIIKPQDLDLSGMAAVRNLITLTDARLQAERDAIITALKTTRNNVTRASKALGISRVTLYRLMETHGIDWQKQKIPECIQVFN